MKYPSARIANINIFVLSGIAAILFITRAELKTAVYTAG
jgi:hypothetical protein